jgi:hypothetical protein
MTSASTFVRRRWRHRQPATSLSRTPDKRATIWLREKEPAQAVPWAAASRVVHLQFDGRTLYALDADARQIVALPPPGQSRSSAQVPRIGDPSLGDLRAFSPFRGIYYLSRGASRARACAAAPTEVRATAQGLFVYDAAARNVLIQARPMPIGVSIETTFADAEEAIGAFYAPQIRDRGQSLASHPADDRRKPHLIRCGRALRRADRLCGDSVDLGPCAR